MNIPEIVGMILGSSAVTGLITSIVSRRKYKAEADQIESATKLDVAKAAMEYSDRIEKSFLTRIDGLAKEISELKIENIRLREKIDILVDENIKLRMEIVKLSHREDKI